MPLLGYPRLPSLTLILWAWPVVAGGLATYQYFHVWAPSPAAYLALEGDVTAAATVIQSDTPRYAATYVASRYGPNPTISFLDGAEFGRLRWFDGRVALPLPPPGAGPTLYVLPRTAVDPSWYTRLPAADRVALIAAPDTGPGVEAFVLRPDELGPSHPLEAPVDFGGAARLIGADVPRVWQAGVATSPTFYWQVDRPPSGEVKFWAHLVDASGFTWAQYDEVAYPAAEWQPGQTLIVRHALAVPDVAPPGAYTLSVGLERLDGSALGASDSSGKSLGNAWTSTTVDLARPAHPPDPTALKPGRALDVTFGSSVRLFGATLDQSQARDGDDLSLTLFWQVLRAPGPVNLSLRLAGSTGAPFAELTRSPMNGRWPATDWRAGDVVVDREVVHLPVGAPAGPATISVGVRDASGVALPGSGGGDVVPVASLTVQRRPLSRAPVAIAHPQVVSFQGSPWLVGYDVVPTRVHPGETVHLTLYWQADQPIDRSWTVFTHLLREGDQVVAQEDGVPARGQRPTTTWEPGEIITDPHDLTVDPGAPPGSDHLEIGLYDVRTGQRRSLTVGGDRVLLDLPIEVLKSGG